LVPAITFFLPAILFYSNEKVIIIQIAKIDYVSHVFLLLTFCDAAKFILYNVITYYYKVWGTKPKKVKETMIKK